MADLFDTEPLAAAVPASAPAVKPKAAPRRPKVAIGRMEIALVAVVVVLLAWGAWVTKTITAGPAKQEFVQLQLQGIIGEYLQAQARSGNDEATAARETAVFMQKLDQTVAGLSREGKIVLVHEAVIGGDIPDVTANVKQAVYSQVGKPKMLPAAGVQGDMEAFLAANAGSDVAAR